MDKVDPKSIIAAGSLGTVDGSESGQTLATLLATEATSSGGAGSSSGAALGSGAFGKVGTYRYHGATVAVKELKAGADEESIGAFFLFGGRHLCAVPHPPLPLLLLGCNIHVTACACF